MTTATAPARVCMRVEVTIEELVQFLTVELAPERTNFSAAARACREVVAFLHGSNTADEKRSEIDRVYANAHRLVTPHDALLTISRKGNLHEMTFEPLTHSVVARFGPVPTLTVSGSASAVEAVTRQHSKLKWEPVAE